MPGSIEEMSPGTLEMLHRFRHVLGLPPISGNIVKDPLANRVYGPLRGTSKIPSAAE